ncbi:subtilisin-like protein [Tothia fuscella]|uniref:Subtilisin-like protein n=1 Tax=Tothia fuscella TaxID=1048955 RepID=A0A9P4TZI1_9PEZI|nr:subtilisin-like protein [Tothia fuscella]
MLSSILLFLLPLCAFAANSVDKENDVAANPQEFVVLYQHDAESHGPRVATANKFNIPANDIVTAVDFGNGYLGFTAVLPPARAAEIERDATTLAVTRNTLDSIKLTDVKDIQLNPANYGLARIRTCAYIVDTGVTDSCENEFGDRLVQKANVIAGEGFKDGIGHGTHVAGPNLVFGSDRRGSNPDALMEAVAFILDDVKNVTTHATCPRGIIVNLSLGIDAQDSPTGAALLNDLTSMMIDATDPAINVFVAAGNEDKPASFLSPANTPGACTIGNIDRQDSIHRGTYWSDVYPNLGASCYGSTGKLWAPGTDILSTWPVNTWTPDTDLGYGPFSNFGSYDTGTSMAAPLVAGVAATILATNSSSFNTISLCQYLQDIATQGSLQNSDIPEFADRGANFNLIAYNGFGE